MNELWKWCVENPEAAITLGYVALSILNGLVKKSQLGWAGGILSKARALLDRVAILTAKDADGTVKLPLMKSK